jgi:hypothetical protein
MTSSARLLSTCPKLTIQTNMKKSKQRNSIRSRQGSNVNLSDCAAAYAASMADPFEGPEDACIPDFPALMTGRFRVWAKGTFSTATGAASLGQGFIVCDPRTATVNDTPSLFVNDPASITGNLISTTSIAGTTVPFFSNSPYATATLGLTGIQSRVVSCGLRIRYVGTEFNRGGQIVGLHHPAHSNLLNFTIPVFDSYKESDRLPVTRDWTTLLYRPVDTNDLNFDPGFDPVASQFFMGFIIQSPDPTGAIVSPYEFEFFCNPELQGNIVQNKMPSHVDVVGHGAVNAVSNMSETMHKPHQVPSSVMAQAAISASSHYISSHVSHPEKPQVPAPPGATKTTGSSSSSSSGTPWYSTLLGIAGDVLQLL